jgi:uncharacterized membrane protein YidH (DUF202 family)
MGDTQRTSADPAPDPAMPDLTKYADIPAPPMPVIDDSNPDHASVAYSRYRTKLSTHRTGLSDHRTALSTNRTEMSSRRTGMSFQRTRMSADRTLMSVIRTSLSMISFGFTIYQFFRGLAETAGIGEEAAAAARVFGQALVWIGVAMLALGILYHLQFMWSLRRERTAMREDGHIHAESPFPVSLTLIVAVLLLALGLWAIASIVFRLGFG